jgi:hypothetical protein
LQTFPPLLPPLPPLPPVGPTAGGQFDEIRVLIGRFLENLQRHLAGQALVDRII